MQKKIITCRRCKREREYYAKDLCISCYQMSKDYGKKWREKHRKYWKEYYKKNREKLIKRQVEWRKNNPKSNIRR